MTALPFSTCWTGRLSGLERACLGSILAHGHALRIYHYGALEGAPEGAELRDAAVIAPEADQARFLFAGRPTLAHFADHFRYLLLAREETIWIDADMVLLRPLDWPAGERLVAREDAATVCGTILHLPPGDHALPRLIARCRSLMDRELPGWGATGPAALTETIGLDSIAGPHRFYPIHWRDFWMPFLPGRRDECAALCRDADTLHLWNTFVSRLGLSKDAGPPEGSYLHAVFAEAGLLGCFDGLHPAVLAEEQVAAFLARRDGR